MKGKSSWLSGGALCFALCSFVETFQLCYRPTFSSEPGGNCRVTRCFHLLWKNIRIVSWFFNKLLTFRTPYHKSSNKKHITTLNVTAVNCSLFENATVSLCVLLCTKEMGRDALKPFEGHRLLDNQQNREWITER